MIQMQSRKLIVPRTKLIMSCVMWFSIGFIVKDAACDSASYTVQRRQLYFVQQVAKSEGSAQSIKADKNECEGIRSWIGESFCVKPRREFGKRGTGICHSLLPGAYLRPQAYTEQAEKAKTRWT
jgi:hypothetical protein